MFLHSGYHLFISWNLVSYDHTQCKLVIIIQGSQDTARPCSAQRSLGHGHRAAWD